ncbi:hypothetical protein AVEN_114280-1 [Araneus ventricosus]|uniref:Uncharacterized protein n=1 Tax=Araneus ventricosus TaxID=182803 RepID=A0A4Y2MSF9_ARAVE|nr:hypothetical protein AVEN_114280-1 [Araneus ventricosus]
MDTHCVPLLCALFNKNTPPTHYYHPIIENGPGYYQNLLPNFNFPKDINGREFSEIYFCRILPNNERVERDWLQYSVENNSACCKIFNDFSNLKLSSSGFKDRNHLREHLKLQEKSKMHFQMAFT